MPVTRKPATRKPPKRLPFRCPKCGYRATLPRTGEPFLCGRCLRRCKWVALRPG